MTSGLDITLQNETRSRKVLSSNPGIRSGMGNFSYLFNCIITFCCSKRPKGMNKYPLRMTKILNTSRCFRLAQWIHPRLPFAAPGFNPKHTIYTFI